MSCKWNQTVCILLHVASFALPYVCDICPYCTCSNSSFFAIAGPLGTSPFMLCSPHLSLYPHFLSTTMLTTPCFSHSQLPWFLDVPCSPLFRPLYLLLSLPGTSPRPAHLPALLWIGWVMLLIQVSA